MKKISLVAAVLTAATSHAEISLPNPVNENLSAAQIEENINYLNNVANDALADIEALQQVQTTKVLQRMSAGDETTLLQRDDVAVKARCTFINSNDSAAGRKLELWSETTTAGTLVYNENESGYFGDTDNQTSEWVSRTTANDTSWEWSNYIDQGVLVTPGGTVVMMDGETFGYGLNVQGSDCLLVGQIHSFSGSAAPEDFDPSIEAPVLLK